MFFKSNWPLIIVLLLIVFGFKFKCGRDAEPKVKVIRVINTVTIRDTVESKPKAAAKVAPLPNQVTPKIVSIPGDTDYVIHPADTVNVWNDYYSTYYYSDTIRTKYGTIVINDSISRNAIDNRNVFTDFAIPVANEQVTFEAPKKPTLFATSGLLTTGRLAQSAIGVGLLLKTRKDKLIGVSIYRQWDGKLIYEAKAGFKL